jgi:TetR/AcrR family transcriptional regulator
MSVGERVKTVRQTPPRTARRRTARPKAALPDHDGRERILAAAIRAFSEVGYAGATTAGIARDAGVTQPLVHHHFGSKDGLWQAAADAVFSNIPRFAAPSSDAAPRDALGDIVERFVRFVAAHPEVTRIIAREGAAPSPRLDYLLRTYLREPFREVVDLIRGAQTAGIVTRDVRPELALFLVLGAGSHLFDVSALAQRSQGIDTTSAWTRESFVVLMRTVLVQGLFSADR